MVKFQVVGKQFIFLSIFFISAHTQGQRDTCMKNRSRNTLFVELGGNAIAYSINYERILRIDRYFIWSGRLGLHHSRAGTIVPFEFTGSYLFHREFNFIEFGTGLSFAKLHFNSSDLLFSTFRLGYRRQKPNGGFFLKFGMTPLLELYYSAAQKNVNYRKFKWFFGVGAGYTFRKKTKTEEILEKIK